MFAKSIILVALAIGVAHGASVPVKDSTIQELLRYVAQGNTPKADAGNWVDEILANLRDEIKKNNLATVPIPDTSFNFSQVILGVNWHGEAVLTEGFVGGFETIHRTGAAELATDPNGDIIIFVDAGVNDGVLGAKLSVKFMNLGPTATVSGSIKNIQVKLGIRVNLFSKVASLETFDVHNLGTLSIDVKGLGIILNFLVEIVVNIFGNLVKGIVGELLQGVIKNLINQLIADTLYPEKYVRPLVLMQQHAAIIPRVLPYIKH